MAKVLRESRIADCRLLNVTGLGELFSTPPGLSRWNRGLETTRGDQRDFSFPSRPFQVGKGEGEMSRLVVKPYSTGTSPVGMPPKIRNGRKKTELNNDNCPALCGRHVERHPFIYPWLPNGSPGC